MGKNYACSSNELKYVNKEKIKDMFLFKRKSQFENYIKNKTYMQWGGLADQFDNFEKKHGVTLDLLKFFKEINYPICFSTKATWWTEDERYMKLFENQPNWFTKFSIICLDEGRSRKIELGVDSPVKRLEAIKKVDEINKGTTILRLRPFILGLTDKHDEYLELIKQAYDNGARAVSTEFFCMENRASEETKQRFNKISQVLGFDIFDFYKKNSTGQGYLRLNYNIKKPYILRMKALCEQLGMRFYVSDAHHKEKCNNGSCCGLPESENYSRGQFTEAILIAKKNRVVKFSDIENNIKYLKEIKYVGCEGFNTGSCKLRSKLKNQTMYDYFRNIWNNPNTPKSPYKYFGGVLYPIGLDDERNVIYEYREK